jgi:replication factor C large subunit
LAATLLYDAALLKYMKPWVHIYAPKEAKDIVGQQQAVERVRHYIQHYKPGGTPVLLIGKPGIGKTSMVQALAHELDKELLEVNASDSRNKDAIESIVGEAAKQQSLFFRGKILLIDEVDGVSGMSDRGGIATLVGIVPQSRYPLIFTANEDSDKLKPLKKICDVLELNALNVEDVQARLSHIARAEKIAVEEEVLRALSRRSAGDLRAAINDLQSLTHEKVTKESVEQLSERESKEEMQQALTRIFKTTSAEMALPAFENVDEDVDGLLMWIDENIPREYKNPEDLARAFDALAEADKYFGRIRRWQYYRFYVYIYNLLTAGIAMAKDKKYAGTIEYKPTGRILKMWIYNQKNAKKKKVAEILAPQLHTSKRRVRQDVLPYLKIIYQKDKKKGKQLIESYGIDEEAAEWFEK